MASETGSEKERVTRTRRRRVLLGRLTSWAPATRTTILHADCRLVPRQKTLLGAYTQPFNGRTSLCRFVWTEGLLRARAELGWRKRGKALGKGLHPRK